MGAAANRKKAWNAFLSTVSEQERREWAVLASIVPISACRFEGGRTEEGLKPLHFGAISKHVPLLQALLAVNADPNERTARKVAPLMYAVVSQDITTIKILLDAGAEINAQDDQGFTVLFDTGDRHDEELTRFLLDAGADATIRDNSGATVGELYPFIDELVAEKKAKDDASALAEKHGIATESVPSRGGVL